MGLETREQLWRNLQQGRIATLYLLFGAEEYLRSQAARVISDQVLRDTGLREFNEASFNLASIDVQQAIAAACQLPMMTHRRVIRISDFGKLREPDEEALLRYIARPAESTVMIFIANDIDKRRKLSKALLDACVAVEFSPMTDAELSVWARARLKELKAEAADDALRQIIALVGQSVRTLATELDKLATGALPSNLISLELVESLVGRSRELSNFELTDHLVAGNRGRALETLRRLLDDGVEPVLLIGLVGSNYHRLLLAKELMARGAANTEVFRLVPLPFNKREDFLATARRASAPDLVHRIERIAAADLSIKTSQATPRLQLEMLVCELAS
ncbi:MAG: DNA polymerase III subunit delta [Pyrinomonadaceae bacterium]|nr:DNA polymerase III subunit delta [Pyrinomonadaceae bacterium]